MKRFLSLIAAMIAVAATAPSTNAAFTLSIDTGAYNESTGAFTGAVNRFFATTATNSLNGSSIDLLPPPGSGQDLTLTYDLLASATSVTVNQLRLSYNPGVPPAGSALDVRVTITYDGVVLPTVAGQGGIYSGNFSFAGGSNSGTGLNVMTMLSQNGSDTTLRAGTPPPSGFGLIQTAGAVPNFFAASTGYTQSGASSSATITDTAFIRFAAFENIALSGSSGVAVAPVPAPATALLALLGLPVAGIARRFRRTVA